MHGLMSESADLRKVIEQGAISERRWAMSLMDEAFLSSLMPGAQPRWAVVFYETGRIELHPDCSDFPGVNEASFRVHKRSAAKLLGLSMRAFRRKCRACKLPMVFGVKRERFNRIFVRADGTANVQVRDVKVLQEKSSGQQIQPNAQPASKCVEPGKLLIAA